MRKQERVVLWPVYFDSTKTRSGERRVSKRLAVPAPTLEEVRRAAEELGLRPETVPGAANPGHPRQKTGLVTVPRRKTKTELIREIGERICENRRKIPVSKKGPKGLRKA